MKNEIDQTVERIGQLPDIYVWKFPDGTRIKIIAFSAVDVKRWADGHYDGYIDESYSLYSQGFHYAPSTAYTQLKADLANITTKVERLRGIVPLIEKMPEDYFGYDAADNDSGAYTWPIRDEITANLRHALDAIGKE